MFPRPASREPPVVALDYTSLYPSVMAPFNLSVPPPPPRILPPTEEELVSCSLPVPRMLAVLMHQGWVDCNNETMLKRLTLELVSFHWKWSKLSIETTIKRLLLEPYWYERIHNIPVESIDPPGSEWIRAKISPAPLSGFPPMLQHWEPIWEHNGRLAALSWFPIGSWYRSSAQQDFHDTILELVMPDVGEWGDVPRAKRKWVVPHARIIRERRMYKQAQLEHLPLPLDVVQEVMTCLGINFPQRLYF